MDSIALHKGCFLLTSTYLAYIKFWFNNYPTQTDIIGLASPQQLKSLNRDVKYRLKLIRNHYTTPETSGQTHVPRQQLNLDFPKALPTSLRPAFSYISCNSNPSSNHKAPRYSFFFNFPNSIHVAKKIPDSSFKRRKIWNRDIINGCL